MGIRFFKSDLFFEAVILALILVSEIFCYKKYCNIKRKNANRRNNFYNILKTKYNGRNLELQNCSVVELLTVRLFNCRRLFLVCIFVSSQIVTGWRMTSLKSTGRSRANELLQNQLKNSTNLIQVKNKPYYCICVRIFNPF